LQLHLVAFVPTGEGKVDRENSLKAVLRAELLSRLVDCNV